MTSNGNNNNATAVDKKRRCRALADYIFSIRANRKLTLSLNDGREKQYCFPRTINRNELESAKMCIDIACSWLVNYGGGCVFRYSSKIKGKDVLNGFYAKDGKIYKCNTKQIQLAYETMPDGSLMPDENVIYQMAPIDID